MLIDFQIGNNPYCKFVFDSTVVTFWYEREFAQGSHAWIQRHRPDFTAMVNDIIIVCF